MTEEKIDEPGERAGDDRGISVGRDASGNAFVTGDNNSVKVVIYQSVSERREPEEPRSTEIGPNPYMGLLAFHEEDADRFFGREKQISRLWEKLRDLHLDSSQRSATPRLLPILGPSGSGKSSVARAGLIPELARRPLPGWRDARVAVFTPGSHPLERLAHVLAQIATGEQVPPFAKKNDFEQELQRQRDNGQCEGLRRIADTLPDIASTPLIILVDQFEEIYSLCDDKQERTVFIENLLHATSDAGGRASVVITLRTDFLSETQTHELLNRVICEQQVMIPAMNEAELRDVIAKPAALAGHPLDDATITLLVNDARDREGALPLLQFALMRIWDGLTQGIEPTVTYEKIGGVGGALAGEAERIYQGLPDDQQRIAKRVFLGLVQLGEGTRDTRRRAVVAKLVSVGEDVSQVEQVIRRFSGRDARLVTLSADEQGTADTAEVTHEALFTHWKLLNVWLDENRDDIRFSRRLDEAAHTWDQQGRPDGGLWRPPNLELLRQFHARLASEMNSLQTDFYLASDQGEKVRVAKERRQQIALRSLLAVAASTALLAIVMLALALASRSKAKKTEQLAQQGRIDALVDSIYLATFTDSVDYMTTLEKVAASESLKEHAITKLHAKMTTPPKEKASPQDLDTQSSGKANVGIALVRMGKFEKLSSILEQSKDPATCAYIIHRLNQAGVDAKSIVSRLKKEQEPSVRQALILSLGEYDETHFPSGERDKLIPKLVKLYSDDPDPGVHAASEWLLRQWKKNGQIKQAADKLREDKPLETLQQLQDSTIGQRRWYITPHEQTMVFIKGPVTFRMGSPESETGRDTDEVPHDRTVDHSFAIAANEVTVGQFLKFREAHEYATTVAPDLDCPAIEVTWYDAADYCNWLTDEENKVREAAGVRQLEKCYEPNEKGEYAEGMKIATDYLQRGGYRLPTEAEWEYACRGGATSRYCFGEAETLLAKYARYANNSEDRSWSVGSLKPNGFGLFDMHGNVVEWCLDEYAAYASEAAGNPTGGLIWGSVRVYRGGSWYYGAVDCRSAYRSRYAPDYRYDILGFRVARSPSGQPFKSSGAGSEGGAAKPRGAGKARPIQP